jgi:hypothetical protein
MRIKMKRRGNKTVEEEEKDVKKRRGEEKEK